MSEFVGIAHLNNPRKRAPRKIDQPIESTLKAQKPMSAASVAPWANVHVSAGIMVGISQTWLSLLQCQTSDSYGSLPYVKFVR